MKKMITALATCAALVPAAAFANAEAIAAAQKAGICDVTGASFLASGQLSVQCRPGTVAPEYQSLIQSPAAGGALGAGLTTGTALAIGGGLVLVAVLVGDDDDTTTTTTTTGS